MGGPEEFQELVARYHLALDQFNQADVAYFDQANEVLTNALDDLNRYILDCKRQLGFPVHSTFCPHVICVS